ncbi:MAG: flagellar filament capping protein FliD [Sulfuricella denitrificans]|nr:flagellar filament capping protein FliD [Sulfuricella denitrificans]
MAVSASSSAGIDVNAIVTGLMSIERQPIDKLNTKEASFKSKLTALGLIKSQVSTFQSSLKGLGSTSSSNFVAFKATSSDTSIFSASASSTAEAGSYSLEVSSLAQSQKLVAAGQVSSTAAIGNGTTTTVTFDFGTISGGTLTAGVYSGATFTSNGNGTKSLTIDSTNNTLEGIRNAINAAKAGVTATIVNDGSGTPYRLALSSDSTGISNSIKITTSGGDGTINTLLAHDPGGLPAAQHLNQTVVAQNANFTVNGIAITKNSNIVTDAVQGVALTLNKITTSPATLTVARDSSAVTDAVAGFVKSYNDLYTAMKNAYAYKSTSALEGEATLRSMQTQMRSIANQVVGGGTMSQLYEIGLNFQLDGTLSLDSSKLSNAIAANFNDVANLFNNASTGYATKFDQWATTTLAADGALAARTNGINASIKSIGNQRDTLETRMVGIEKRLRIQYSSLNVMLSELSKTSEYLAKQLG